MGLFNCFKSSKKETCKEKPGETKQKKEEQDSYYEDYYRNKKKKEHYSDFELADFCHGGDLTEDC